MRAGTEMQLELELADDVAAVVVVVAAVVGGVPCAVAPVSWLGLPVPGCFTGDTECGTHPRPLGLYPRANRYYRCLPCCRRAGWLWCLSARWGVLPPMCSEVCSWGCVFGYGWMEAPHSCGGLFQGGASPGRHPFCLAALSQLFQCGCKWPLFVAPIDVLQRMIVNSVRGSVAA